MKKLISRLAASAVAASVMAGSPALAQPAIKPIPELARWESQMKSFGKTNCDYLKNPNIGFDPKLAATYYDGEWVFYQIADYTKDTFWRSCAAAAEAAYRKYVLDSVGTVPGYWNFTHGLTQDFLRTGDQTSKNAAILLSRNAAYSRDSTPVAETQSVDLSREVAYAIMGYLNTEALGEPRRPRLATLVNQAFGHLDQWFVKKTAPNLKPFMVGLTSHALISYYEKTRDARVLPALKNAMDQLWTRTWKPDAEAFLYIDRNVAGEDPPNPAPDLNLLIASAYAWIYYETGEIRFRDRGDQIFAGGVKRAYLANGKQFNQNYRWSFEYVKWRKMQPRVAPR